VAPDRLLQVHARPPGVHHAGRRSTAPARQAANRRVQRGARRRLHPLRAVHFDGNAVFDYRFQPKDVSKHDYFHPSREGQRVLAEVTWQAGFQFAP
jgi:hypothetical protein